MVTDQQTNNKKRNYSNEPFFTKTLYLWNNYILLIEIMLTSINYFFMSGADELVLTENWF